MTKVALALALVVAIGAAGSVGVAPATAHSDVGPNIVLRVWSGHQAVAQVGIPLYKVEQDASGADIWTGGNVWLRFRNGSLPTSFRVDLPDRLDCTVSLYFFSTPRPSLVRYVEEESRRWLPTRYRRVFTNLSVAWAECSDPHVQS